MALLASMRGRYSPSLIWVLMLSSRKFAVASGRVISPDFTRKPQAILKDCSTTFDINMTGKRRRPCGVPMSGR